MGGVEYSKSHLLLTNDVVTRQEVNETVSNLIAMISDVVEYEDKKSRKCQRVHQWKSAARCKRH